MANYRHSKKTLLAFLTALSISLGASGCTNTDKKQLRKEIETEIDTQVTSTPSSTLTPKELKEIEKEEIEMELLVAKYLDYFSTIDVEYPNEKYYPTKKEIDEILALDDTYQEYHHQNSLSMKELYRIVKKNTTSFVKKHPEFQNPFSSSRDNFKDFKSNLAFQFAFEHLLKDLENEATNDFSEDICRIKNLKIVFGNLTKDYNHDLVTGIYFPKENYIVMDKKAIRKAKKIHKDDDFIDKQELILEHLLSYLRLNACKHKLKKGQNFERILGMGNNTTLSASSAASSIYALDESGYFDVDTFDFDYTTAREDESLILLLGLFRNKTYSDYYNAISDANPEAFYQFCGVKSKKEKYTLYKILAAFDGKNGYNDIGFNVMKSNKISSEDAKKSIRYNYKLDIFHRVLSDMVDYTATNPDFTLKENLQMLNIIECCLLNESVELTLSTKNKFDQKFITDFYQSETKYLDFLSEYYFKGEKNRNYIKKHYEEDYKDSTAFNDCFENLSYHNNELLQKFPLLKPIVFANQYSEWNHIKFLEKNKKFIKENVKQNKK